MVRGVGCRDVPPESDSTIALVYYRGDDEWGHSVVTTPD